MELFELRHQLVVAAVVAGPAIATTILKMSFREVLAVLRRPKPR